MLISVCWFSAGSGPKKVQVPLISADNVCSLDWSLFFFLWFINQYSHNKPLTHTHTHKPGLSCPTDDSDYFAPLIKSSLFWISTQRSNLSDYKIKHRARLIMTDWLTEWINPGFPCYATTKRVLLYFPDASYRHEWNQISFSSILWFWTSHLGDQVSLIAKQQHHKWWFVSAVNALQVGGGTDDTDEREAGQGQRWGVLSPPYLVVSAWSAFSRVSFPPPSCSGPRGWGTEHYHYRPLTLHGRAGHINKLTAPWSFFLRPTEKKT